MIKLIYPSKNIEADRKEILRYMGCKNADCDSNLLYDIDTVSREISESADFKGCFVEKDLVFSENSLNFGTGMVESKSLMKNLTGCEKVIIFCATAGTLIDRIINKYSMLSPVKALIADASANALIESFCDDISETLKDTYKLENKFLRPRFSPGYGDFDLSFQKDFLKVLDATRKTGITLTEGNMMVPVKSVTALMGVSQTDDKCHISGCENCKKTDCNFRRM